MQRDLVDLLVAITEAHIKLGTLPLSMDKENFQKKYPEHFVSLCGIVSSVVSHVKPNDRYFRESFGLLDEVDWTAFISKVYWLQLYREVENPSEDSRVLYEIYTDEIIRKMYEGRAW